MNTASILLNIYLTSIDTKDTLLTKTDSLPSQSLQPKLERQDVKQIVN